MKSQKKVWCVGGSKARRSIGSSVWRVWLAATSHRFKKDSCNCAAIILPSLRARRLHAARRKAKPRTPSTGSPADFIQTCDQPVDIGFVVEEMRRRTNPF